MKSYLNSEKMNRFLNFTVLASGKLRLAIIVLVVALFSNISNISAATRTASVTGNWNSTATWGGSAVPTSSDDVTINTGVTVTVTANTAVAKTLTINSGGVLNVGGFSITVSGITSISGTLNHTNSSGTKRYTGLVTINSGGVWNNSGNANINLRGGLTNNNSFIAGTGTYTFDTNNQTLLGTISIPKITVTGVALTNNGILTVATTLSGTGGFTQGIDDILNIGGTVTITTLTSTATGNIVNYYKDGAQTAKVATYNNLTLSGSGAKTFATTPTVDGILSLENTATVAVTTGVVTYGANATLQYNTSTAITATNEEWISPFLGSGGVVIANTGTITLNGNKSFTFTDRNGTTSSPLTIKAGSTLANGGYTITSPSGLFLENGTTGSTISGSGTLTLGGNVTVTNSTGTGVGAVISCPVDLNNDRTFTIADDGTTAADLTISGIISGSSDDITKMGLGTLVLSAVNTFSGKTTVSQGTLTLGVADALGGTSEVNLEGGKLVNLAASQVVDAILDVDQDSSIDLGTGSLTFNDSTGKTWDDDSNVLTTLTIYGWTGLDGSGQFFIKDKSDGTSGINSEQLSQIKFSGFGSCGATIIDKGSYIEVVPVSFSIKPTVTITQPTCTLATGSVVLTGLPTSGILKQNDGTVTTTISYTGNSKTIPVLVSGKTYSYTVSNGSCDSSPVNVTISPVATNTWNGTSWSPNIPTDVLHLDQNIVFEGDYGDNKNLYGCSCEVKSGNVVIHENYTLKVTNEVKVTGGSLTFLNTASLVQTNDVANTGNITYNRTTPTVRPTDYVYWSSPVSGQTIANFSPTVGSIKYYYDLGWKAPSDSDVMVKGLGYIIRGQVTSNNKYDASFVGVPNNGPVAITANTAAKYYLVGNPYPSAIDADEFLDQNAGLDGNVYLWTHNTEIAKNAAGTEMVYTSDDYANYNFTGSTSTFKSEECKTCPNNAKPIGKIAAGQSFFVKTISATTIQFNNDMRLESKDKIDNSDQNSQFFRTTNTNTTKSKTAVVEKHRLWLNLTNNQGAFKQTLIGYVTGATNDLDARYDGQNFNGNAFINFYSINQNKNFTIQGRALPFDESDEVALGFKSTMKGSFTIAIDEVDGLFANQDVFIEDKLKGVTFNLKTGNYTFDTEEGTFNERFVIRYINRTLATEDFTIAPNKVLVSVKNKQMKINAAETIDKVVVYDLLGREIFKKSNVNEKELTVLNLISNEQALVVKMIFSNGKIVSRKVVY
jgi:autotransporter-associated beta strand protein